MYESEGLGKGSGPVDDDAPVSRQAYERLQIDYQKAISQIDDLTHERDALRRTLQDFQAEESRSEIPPVARSFRLDEPIVTKAQNDSSYGEKARFSSDSFTMASIMYLVNGSNDEGGMVIEALEGSVRSQSEISAALCPRWVECANWPKDRSSGEEWNEKDSVTWIVGCLGDKSVRLPGERYWLASSSFMSIARRGVLLKEAGLVFDEKKQEACWVMGEPLLDRDGNTRKSGLRRDALVRSWHYRVTLDAMQLSSKGEFPVDVPRRSRRADGQPGLSKVKAWWFGELSLPTLKKPFDLKCKAGSWLKHASGEDGPALSAFVLQAAYSDFLAGGHKNTFRWRKGQLLTGGRAWCAPEEEARPQPDKPVVSSRHESLAVAPTTSPAEVLDKLFASSFQYSEAKLAHLVEKVKNSSCLRIFLSAPFDGCEEEREFFMQSTLNKLVKLCRAYGVSVSVINSRWDINDETAKRNETIFACLRALDTSDILLGYYGTRYGSCALVDVKTKAWIDKGLNRCKTKYPYLEKQYADRSIVEMEWQHAALHGPHAASPSKPLCFFFYRSAAYDAAQVEALQDSDPNKADVFRPPSDPAVQELVTGLRRRTQQVATDGHAAHFENYPSPREGVELMSRCLVGAEGIVNKLLQAIDDENKEVSEYQKLHQAHARYKLGIHVEFDHKIVRDAKAFIERGKTKDAGGTDGKGKPLVIMGASGSGKSTLLAYLSIPGNVKLGEDTCMITHFMGIDSESAMFAEVMRGLWDEFCHKVRSKCGDAEVKLEPFEELYVDQVLKDMNKVCMLLDESGVLPSGSVIILIDAINQIDDKIPDGCYSEDLPSLLKWVPSDLQHIRVVLSCIHPGGSVVEEDAMTDKTAHRVLLSVEERGFPQIRVLPLTEDQREWLIREWHDYHGKEVDKSMELLWDSKTESCANPMFLSLTLNHINVYGTSNTMETIRDRLLEAHNVLALLIIIIGEIEASEYTFKAGGSDDAVATVLKTIFCSRAGLTAAELTTLTGINGSPDDVNLAWLKMENNLQQLLVLRGGVYKFSQDNVRQAVKARYALTYDAEIEVHKQLCDFFLKQSDQAGTTSEGSTRAMKELTYHERKAGIRPSVSVVARIRPFGTNERERQSAVSNDVCKVDGSRIVTIADLDSKKMCKFSFDCVLDSRDARSKVYKSQEDVFKLTCEGVIAQQAIAGFNSTIIAYGQVGSGKTYTMFGTKADPGLIYRTLQQLMDSLREETHKGDQHFTVSVSMVEVKSSGNGRAGDEIIVDLLSPSRSNARLLESSSLSPSSSSSTACVTTWICTQAQERLENITRFEALVAIMEEGYKRRATRSHALNDASSRSHCIFTVSVYRQPKASKRNQNEAKTFHAKINLVDLAGSERGKKTHMKQGVDKAASQSAAKEAISTNSSLSALNACIEAVAFNRAIVPYRNSKLTRILQDTLGGTAKTVFLATVSPCADDRQETLSTLGFAALAKQMTASKDEALKLREEEVMAEAEAEAEAAGIDGGALPLHFAVKAKGTSRLPKVTDGAKVEIPAIYRDDPDKKDDGGPTALHRALRDRASEAVILAVLEAAKEAALQEDKSEKLPLHVAAGYKASNRVIKTLLQVNPGAAMQKDNTGGLPLHVAVDGKASKEVVQLIIKAYPEALKEKDNTGKQPLHVAVKSKASKEVVLLLMEAYPEAVKEKDNLGKQPLHVAAGSKASLEVITALLVAYPEATSERDSADESLPLHIAAVSKAPVEVFSAIFAEYPDAAKMKDNQGRLPMHLATEFKTFADVIIFLANKFPDAVKEKDANGRLPLHLAVNKGLTLEVINALLDIFPQAVSEKDKDEKTAHDYSTSTQSDVRDAVNPNGADTRLLGLLLKADSEKSLKNRLKMCKRALLLVTPEAARESDEDRLEKRRVSVHKDAPRPGRRTSLHLAVTLGHAALVKALLDAYPGAASELGEDKQLPLHLAVSKKSFERCREAEAALEAAETSIAFKIVTLLLGGNNSAAAVKDTLQQLPLHISVAAEAPHDVVEKLLGANPSGAEERDAAGNLPLHIALKTKSSMSKVVSMLLEEYPAGARALDDEGMLPVRLACSEQRNSHEIEVVKSLLVGDLQEDNFTENHGALSVHSLSWTWVIECTDPYINSVKALIVEAAFESMTKRDCSFIRHCLALAHSKDKAGRDAINVVKADVRQIMHKYILFCERYELQEGPPIHRSATAVVIAAKDLGVAKDYSQFFVELASSEIDETEESVDGEVDDSYDPERYADALEKLHLAAEQHALSLGPLHADTLKSRNDLALLLSKTGDHAAALAVSEPLWNDSKESLGPAHEDTLMYSLTHALVLSSHGDKKYQTDALRLYNEVLKARKEDCTLDEKAKQRAILRAHAELSGFYERTKDFKKAHREYETAYRAAEEDFGPKDADYISFKKKAEEIAMPSMPLKRRNLRLSRACFCANFPEIKKRFGKEFEPSEEGELIVDDGNETFDQWVLTKASSATKDDEASEEDIKMTEDEFVAGCTIAFGKHKDVVIKFMQDENQFKQELEVRNKGKLDAKHVILTLKTSAEDQLPMFKEQVKERTYNDGKDEKPLTAFQYGFVMPHADRSLDEIHRKERPDLERIRTMMQEVANALEHCHNKNIVHGDLKMLNVLRYEGRIKLIDMDASCVFDPDDSEKSEYFGAKFSSGVLPPEMFYELPSAKEREDYKKYWDDIFKADLDRLEKETAKADYEEAKAMAKKIHTEKWAKVSPRLALPADMKARWIVVKTFAPTFKNGKEEPYRPEELPYKLVRASPALDVWAFGCMLYQLLASEPLLPANLNDDLARPKDMLQALTWTKEQLKAKIDAIQVLGSTKLLAYAKDLLERVLQTEASERPSMTELLGYDFFTYKISTSNRDENTTTVMASGSLALHQALKNREFDTVIQLLKREDLQKQLLARQSSREVGKEVEKKKDEKNIAKEKDGEGMLPLHWALVTQAPEDVVIALITKFPGGIAEKDDEDNLPLHWAHANGADVDVIVKLIFKTASREIHQDELLRWTLAIDVLKDKPDKLQRVVERVFTLFKDRRLELAHCKDAVGREAISIAHPEVQRFMYREIFFCGRYELEEGRPVHRSVTAVVIFAQDHSVINEYEEAYKEAVKDGECTEKHELDLNGFKRAVGKWDLSEEKAKKEFESCDKDGSSGLSLPEFLRFCADRFGKTRKVAIKFMLKEEQYNQEMKARRDRTGLDDTFVVAPLPGAPFTRTEAVPKLPDSPAEDAESNFKSFVEDFKFDKELDKIIREDGEIKVSLNQYVYGFVMPAADRSLDDISKKELPNINDIKGYMQHVAEALRHCHAQGIIHGDLKLENVVRVKNVIKLIDFDASANIGSPYGAKFSSGNLPPEMFHVLQAGEEAKYRKYWDKTINSEDVSDKRFWQKIKPQTGKNATKVVVKTFMPGVPEGLPYDPIVASPAIDIWAFGVMLYRLLEKTAMLPTKDDGDLKDANSLLSHIASGDLGKKINGMKITEDELAAKNLLVQILQPNPGDRISIDKICKHAFFAGSKDKPRSDSFREEMQKGIEEGIQKGLEKSGIKETMDEIKTSMKRLEKISLATFERLKKTEKILLRGIQEAHEVTVPSTFIVVTEKLRPPHTLPDADADADDAASKAKMAKAEEDFVLEHGEHGKEYMKEAKKRAETFVNYLGRWADHIVKGELTPKFPKMTQPLYLYLVNEVTHKPVIPAEGSPGFGVYPLKISTATDFFEKMIPFVRTGLCLLKAYNSVAAVAQCFGPPICFMPRTDPIVTSVENVIGGMTAASNVAQWVKDDAQGAAKDTQHSTASSSKTAEEKAEAAKAARGHKLRELAAFFEEHDKGKNFCGLQRYLVPTGCLWTTEEDMEELKKTIDEEERGEGDGNDIDGEGNDDEGEGEEGGEASGKTRRRFKARKSWRKGKGRTTAQPLSPSSSSVPLAATSPQSLSIEPDERNMLVQQLRQEKATIEKEYQARLQEQERQLREEQQEQQRKMKEQQQREKQQLEKQLLALQRDAASRSGGCFGKRAAPSSSSSSAAAGRVTGGALEPSGGQAQTRRSTSSLPRPSTGSTAAPAATSTNSNNSNNSNNSSGHWEHVGGAALEMEVPRRSSMSERGSIAGSNPMHSSSGKSERATKRLGSPGATKK